MSEIEWKPGDVAWIECEPAPGLHMYDEDGDWQAVTAKGGVCVHFRGRLGDCPQPVLILRPNDEAGMDALARKLVEESCFVRRDATQTAVQKLIAAQHPPKMPEEPLDPAVRVLRDKDGEIFARCGDDVWAGDVGNVLSWEELTSAPVEIITPDGGGEA